MRDAGRWQAGAVLVVALTLVPAVAVAAAPRQARPQAAAGALSVPGAGKVRIVWDNFGVPHVFASTERALFFGEGYAVGRDRLWQAELLRRIGTGTVAAMPRVGGPSSALGDLEFREYTGGRAHLTKLVMQLPRAARVAVQGFSDGMNAWIAAATRAHALPPEYAAIGLKPRPWTPEDVIATWFVAESQYGSFGSDELDNARQLASWRSALGPRGAAKVFADTHWLDDPSAPTTIPRGLAPAARPAPAYRPLPAVHVSRRLADKALAQQRAAAATLARFGQGARWHSNAFVLSGKMTRDGASLLLGGPQAQYSVPQTFYEIGLHGAGYDVTGVTIPGTVAVEIGAGAGHAWSVTSGGTDNSDWYTDIIDPAAHPGRYLFNGRWVPYACRTETIAVYRKPSRRYRVCAGRHGPVYAASGDTALARRDAGAEGLDGTISGFIALDAAHGLGRFAAALERMAGSFNILYAGQAGNIGYWQVGQVPVRAPGDNPFLPHPGTGGDEWRGYLPWRDMPRVMNPVRGWLANWNNKPRPGWPNSAAGFLDWGPVQRVQALTRQLAVLRPHTATVATMERINRVAGQTAESPVGNEGNIAVHQLLPRLLALVHTAADPRLPEAMRLLSRWNGQRTDGDRDGRYDRPAVTIWQYWYPAFIKRAFAATLGFLGKGSVDDTVLTDMAVRLVEGRAAALPLHYNYLHGRPPGRVATATLIHTLDAVSARYHTPRTGRWLLPDAFTRWQPLGLSTVPRTPWMNRGTYNQIIHLGRGRQFTGVNVVAPGEAAQAGSPYFSDQLRLYAAWRYKAMLLTAADLRGHITGDIVLTVP